MRFTGKAQIDQTQNTETRAKVLSTARPGASYLPATGRSSALPPRRSSAAPPDELQVLERTADYCISTWRDIMFLAWRGPETAGGIVRSRDLMETWAPRRQGGVVLVVLMNPAATMHHPPDEDARAAMGNVSRDASSLFKGIGIIGNDSGFIGSVVRSVMTARQLLVRTPVPFRMFSTAAEAAPWIARCLELKENLGLEFVAVVERAYWK